MTEISETRRRGREVLAVREQQLREHWERQAQLAIDREQEEQAEWREAMSAKVEEKPGDWMPVNFSTDARALSDECEADPLNGTWRGLQLWRLMGEDEGGARWETPGQGRGSRPWSVRDKKVDRDLVRALDGEIEDWPW